MAASAIGRSRRRLKNTAEAEGGAARAGLDSLCPSFGKVALHPIDEVDAWD
jgi:hypothetical protein